MLCSWSTGKRVASEPIYASNSALNALVRRHDNNSCHGLVETWSQVTDGAERLLLLLPSLQSSERVIGMPRSEVVLETHKLVCLMTDAVLWIEPGVNGRWPVLCGVSGRETEKCVRGVAYLSPEDPVMSLLRTELRCFD